MSRLLLLSILVLWMCPRDNAPTVMARLPATMLFLGLYAIVVTIMALWSRHLARRVADDFLGKTLDRYNRATELTRYFIPAWFAVGVFALGWGRIVYDLLAPLDPALPRLPLDRAISENYWRFPALILGTLPALAAWMGLWWAQYPADRALKEQSLLCRANEGLPIHSPPALGTFFVEQLRMQVLSTLLPILLIILARDVLALSWIFVADRPMSRDGGEWIFLPFAALIFIFAPELYRFIFPTRRLPDHWPLRQRLEALCRRANLKCRDILIWQTNSSVGNAMVMGLFPRVRYVFLSDLLMETMTDEEIEAVFAHEIGHIVHRHMWWYLVFIAILMLLVAGPIALAMSQIPGLWKSPELQAQIATVAGLGLFTILFGYFSRRFERQADVYAARTMQSRQGPSVSIRHYNPDTALAAGMFVAELAPAALGPANLAASSDEPPRNPTTYVGEYGASVVASALHRVAQVNNIPLAAREWLHGSIEHRMRYLQRLSGDRAHTAHFDRYMRRLYWSLLAMLVTLIAWFVVQYGMTGISGPVI